MKIDSGTFSWDKDGGGARPILEDINFRVFSGQLVAIVGQVGAGKSSMLSAILGEMEKLRGNVYTKVSCVMLFLIRASFSSFRVKLRMFHSWPGFKI